MKGLLWQQSHIREERRKLMSELVSLHVFLNPFMYETQLEVMQTGGNVELIGKKQNDIISQLHYFFQK